MVGALILVGLLGYGDAQRELSEALDDFAQEQATLARALGAMISVRGADPSPIREDELTRALGSIERRNELAIFLRRAGDSELRAASDGRALRAATLLTALGHGESVLRLSRAEAAALGLPPRTALAGLTRVDAGRAGQWDIVAVASAGRQRDRDLWAGRRLILSMMLAAGLVLSFGGVAMRTQRKELVLERELALAGVRRQRDERLEQAARAAVVGTFAIGIAHEISTPLGVIAARAEQIQTRAGPDRLAEPAGVILTQVDEIKRVVRAFLGLARGDAPSAETIRPDLLTRTAAKLVEHRFEKAGVTLRYDALPHLPSILGDPKLLEQAIVNLLLNACDASGPGRQVHVFVDQEDGAVAITVDDEGPGISAVDAQRAMQPIFSTAGAAQVRADGSGLGLAIVHEIVANHRGTLALSAARAGTRATIRLPAMAAVGPV